MSKFPVNKRLYQLKSEEDEAPSGRSTPVFPWSPLPQRRQLNFAEQKVEVVHLITH